jgi:anti-anti-sigma factor
MGHGHSEDQSDAESRQPSRGDDAIHELSMRAVAADRYTVIEAYGEIDIASAGELRALIDSSRAGGTDQLILDLSGIRFIDSSGLNVLIGAARHFGSGSFAVIISRPGIRKIFALTGIDSVVPIFESVSDAVRALDSGRAGKEPGARSGESITEATATCEAGSKRVELC